MQLGNIVPFTKKRETAPPIHDARYERTELISELNREWERENVPVKAFPNGVIATTEVNYGTHPTMFRAIQRRLREVCPQVVVQQYSAAQFQALLDGRVLSGEAQHEGEVQEVGVEEETTSGRKNFNELAIDIVTRAHRAESSDIYLDITQQHSVVSYRTNGLKKADPGALTREQGFEVARAMWSLGGAIFEEGIACSASFTYQQRRFRCSSIPSVLGAGVVLRMRDPEFFLPLEACGYSERQIEAIRASSESPGGLFVITGETNSGKSSTLATLMNDLPKTQKIIEISDPVEVVFQHVTQIEINRYAEDAKTKFDRTLGELVRQNPDTLILGEIRDEETAEAAMSMALQGKRVMSTLHTQSCMLSFSRMADLGVDRKLLFQPGFVAAVVNQNLVPLLCPHCAVKEPTGLDETAAKRVMERHAQLFDGQQRYASGMNCGAEKCVDGVIGQTLVAEVYPMVYDRDGELVRMLDENRPKPEIQELVQNRWGLETKHQHAWKKIITGTIDAYYTERIIGRFEKAGDSVYPEAKKIV